MARLCHIVQNDGGGGGGGGFLWLVPFWMMQSDVNGVLLKNITVLFTKHRYCSAAQVDLSQCFISTDLSLSVYGGSLSCGGIQPGYFHSVRWGRLLWCCPLAPLPRWHPSVGCGGVRDERRQRSTSEWLISSELCCPTSEYACTHPHRHTHTHTH